MNGITIEVTLDDGSKANGKPEGMQFVEDTTYMVLKLSDGNLKRIKVPEGWSYTSERGWYREDMV